LIGGIPIDTIEIACLTEGAYMPLSAIPVCIEIFKVIAINEIELLYFIDSLSILLRSPMQVSWMEEQSIMLSLVESTLHQPDFK
jgi:hypothetical protein